MLEMRRAYSERADVLPVAVIPVPVSGPSSADVASVLAKTHPLLAQPPTFEASSTNPVAALLTDGPMFLRAQDASFPFSGRN